MKKLQMGTRKFKGKIPFKCFACDRVGHSASKCSHKENYDKGKDSAKGNRKQFVNRRIYYTHEDSDGLSNSDEGESEQYFKLLKYENNEFMDAFEEEYFPEEMTQLKTCLEEKNMGNDIWVSREDY